MHDLDIYKAPSILTDDVGCARRLNARNVSVGDTGAERGRGVFATREFLPGEIVIVGLLDRMERIRTTDSIQLDWDVHALFEEPAVVVNHSCNPNLAILPNRFGAYDFVAIRQIHPDAEVTWDYATSELECVGVSVCLCSAGNCRGAARGFSMLPPDHPLLASGFFAPYLAKTRTASEEAGDAAPSPQPL
ncbi:Nuclear protein SET [Mesorhizobium plurifarium]|uniref:Nuclear protein SET n=1 Tax=Mesorhizobium plurifarium TaxID=69974 RepID=A0A090F8J3_MESPL|nr:Nuclear protein SET [Mesorhizobium plurifarium]